MIFVLIFLTMMVRDIFATAQILFLARGRRLLAGVADGLGDVANVVSLGVGGVEVATHGLSFTSVLVCVSLFAGSVAGTEIGDRASNRLDRATKHKENR